jgi:hypothetical protein
MLIYANLVAERIEEICKEKGIDLDGFYKSIKDFPLAEKIRRKEIEDPEINTILFISNKLGVTLADFFNSKLFKNI